MALLKPAKRVGTVASPSGVQGEAPEVKHKVQLLGENECSWGPAYWCASRENADRCKVKLSTIYASLQPIQACGLYKLAITQASSLYKLAV